MASAAAAGTDILRRLRRIVGGDGVLDRPSDLLVYARDASASAGPRPLAVVFPRSAGQVSAVVKLCHAQGIPFVPRGAGTGLAGGCVAAEGGVVLAMSRMCEIPAVNLRDRYAVVQPGVVLGRLNQRLQGTGFHVALDPLSQNSCTLGGSIGTNAGGPRSLKYGLARDHVLAVQVVLGDGTLVKVGSHSGDSSGIDLVGLFVGSEGALAVVTEASLRLTRNPPCRETLLAIFDSLEAALMASDEILAAGTTPAALEILDGTVLAALRECRLVRFPAAAKSMLLAEIEGLKFGVKAQRETILDCCQRSGAREIRQAADEAEREKLWVPRSQALTALRRQGPSFWIEDAVVPRSQVGPLLSRWQLTAQQYGIRLANLIHAGDGNLQPVLLFDERDADQKERAAEARQDILAQCLGCGGSVRGEYGLGRDKSQLHSRTVVAEDRDAMDHVCRALAASPVPRPHENVAAGPEEGPPPAASPVEDQPTPAGVP